MNTEWTKEELEFLKNNYTKYTNKELADLMGRTKNSISIKASRLGLKQDKKYNYNQNFFEVIDTEEKAYWLGFMYADGYVSKTKAKNTSYSVGIELNKNDYKHLKKFNKAIDGNFEVVYRDRYDKRWGTTQSMCSIRVYSKKMVEDLIYNGCGYKKTFDITVPNIKDELIKHFLRGFFDGDGSIYSRKNKDYLQCNITSASLKFLESIQLLLVNLEIKSYITNDKNHYQLGIVAKNSADKFLKYIYEDSNIYLDRKYNLFKSQCLPSQ